MTLWVVTKFHYVNSTTPHYTVSGHYLFSYLKSSLKWQGIKGLKWCYLSKKRAKRKAKKLNEEVRCNV